MTSFYIPIRASAESVSRKTNLNLLSIIKNKIERRVMKEGQPLVY